MGFRTLEITQPCDIHIRNTVLVITSEERIILEETKESLKLPRIIQLRYRKFLIKDGYVRIAPEVFMRITQHRQACEKHFRRLSTVTPRTGTVRDLRLTEPERLPDSG